MAAKGLRGTILGAVLAAALLAALAWRLADASPSAGEPAPQAEPAARVGDGQGGFTAARVASFDDPVYVTGPKRAGGLVFVVEQAGEIKIVKGGKKLGGSFLDISHKVQAGGEQGLLSVAFPPNYAKSRRFYVFYTRDGGDLVVEEYRRARKKPRKAKAKSGRVVLTVEHSQNSNHNGGQLQFGPDGNLYIATGDGGAGGDPPENAQNKNSLLGKILRIDPRKRGKKRYTVPRSNPFVNRGGADEVFSLGLRNPYRFSFDGRRIAIGDVGQSDREEIDFETLATANGANFGWDAFEGNIRYPDSDASPPPKQHERPIFDYSHAGGGCAITGGYVSRDKRIRSLRGRYIYADFCKDEIRSLIPSVDGARDDKSLGLRDQAGISSFGEDSRNRIWFANLNSDLVYVLKPR